MSIFSKKFETVSKEDLELLVTQSERESIHLDYKQAINPSTAGKSELVKHVVGMANTEGGYIIFGIKEDKKDGIPIKLDGIDPSVGSQKVDEWIENVVNPHISPRVLVKIRTIKISDKIATILWIPQSSRRPHMSTYENDFRIYRRYNTQTLAASETEIREMYTRSNRMENIRDDFLKERKLLDVTSNDFALTVNSRELLPKSDQIDVKNIPFVIFSACPRFLEERVDISSDAMTDWLKKNNVIEIENQNIEVFKPNNLSLDHNSITYNTPNIRNQNILGYLEIQRNAFVEQGHSIRVISSRDQSRLFLNLGRLTVAFWAFLRFIKNFDQKIDYLDEFTTYLSIRNVNHLELNGFMGLSENGHPWAAPEEDADDYVSTPQFSVVTYATVIPSKPKMNNFQYQRLLLMNELDDEKISETVKNFSTRVANAFGLQKAQCYNIDGTIAKIHLDTYHKFFR